MKDIAIEDSQIDSQKILTQVVGRILSLSHAEQSGAWRSPIAFVVVGAIAVATLS